LPVLMVLRSYFVDGKKWKDHGLIEGLWRLKLFAFGFLFWGFLCFSSPISFVSFQILFVSEWQHHQSLQAPKREKRNGLVSGMQRQNFLVSALFSYFVSFAFPFFSLSFSILFHLACYWHHVGL
jgi:hypothetical protein